MSSTSGAAYSVTPPVAASATATAREWSAPTLVIPSSRKSAYAPSSASNGQLAPRVRRTAASMRRFKAYAVVAMGYGSLVLACGSG